MHLPSLTKLLLIYLITPTGFVCALEANGVLPPEPPDLLTSSEEHRETRAIEASAEGALESLQISESESLPATVATTDSSVSTSALATPGSPEVPCCPGPWDCESLSKKASKLLDPGGPYRVPSSFRPLGDAVNTAFSVQRYKGMSRQMVLYRYDFVSGRASLKRRGHSELRRMLPVLAQFPFLLFIEPTGDTELDLARRLAVLEAIEETPFPILGERVVVADPEVYGLDGIDAILVHDRLLQSNSPGVSAGPINNTVPTTGAPPAR